MRDLRSSLTLLAAGGQVLQIADLKEHLRIEFDDADEDDYLNALNDAAQSHFDGRDGILGRALLTQRWRLDLETFYDPRQIGSAGYFGGASAPNFSGMWNPYGAYYGEIKIPLPPLQSVDAVKYLDSNGVLQTVDAGSYRTIRGGGSRSSIVPKPGFSWPASMLCAPDAVQIDFTAGYTTVETLSAERKGILHAMLLLIAHWFQNREAVTDGRVNQPFELSFAVERLIAPHRLPAM